MDTDALIARFAADLGHAPATVKKWRQRGKVPHHAREQLREHAAAAGYIIRREHFDTFGGDRAVAA